MMWIKRKYHHIVDLLIAVVGINFALLIEGKYDGNEWIKNHPVNAIVLMALISIILVVIKIIYEVKQVNLKEEVSASNEENIFLKGLISNFKYQISQPLEDKLYQLSNELTFDNKYRITVYTHTTDRFFSIGRYSQNTSYKKFGRIAIKDKDELISKAWHDGELIETIKPDNTRNMKSEKIAIKYLYEKNEYNPKKDKFGVVVFETTHKTTKKFNSGKLDEAVKSINDFLNNTMDIRQDLNFAMKEGV